MEQWPKRKKKKEKIKFKGSITCPDFRLHEVQKEDIGNKRQKLAKE